MEALQARKKRNAGSYGLDQRCDVEYPEENFDRLTTSVWMNCLQYARKWKPWTKDKETLVVDEEELVKDAASESARSKCFGLITYL